jgi:hypothetical protein
MHRVPDDQLGPADCFDKLTMTPSNSANPEAEEKCAVERPFAKFRR